MTTTCAAAKNGAAWLNAPSMGMLSNTAMATMAMVMVLMMTTATVLVTDYNDNTHVMNVTLKINTTRGKQ